MRRCWIAAAIMLACVFLGMPHQAAAACPQCRCSASANGVNFGSYNPLLGLSNDSTGTVTVACSKRGRQSRLVAYTIVLSTGSAGSYSPRRMSLAGDRLDYNLYTNNSRTTIWGNGTGGSSVVSDAYSLPGRATVSRSYTVYGRLPGSQNVPFGTYTDVIVVTVTY